MREKEEVVGGNSGTAPANDETSRAVLAFMNDASSYPHSVERIRHVETHISHVFLTGEVAYKIKKPIRLPFLDFSTRTLRKKFCQRELELNSRFAPALYERVVSICQTKEGLAFGDEGEAVEYAVRMKQFDDGDLFSERLASGNLTREQILAMTDQIISFQRSARVTPEYWSYDAVENVMLDNFQICRDSCPTVLSHATLAATLDLCREGLKKNQQLIENRRLTHVKELHGDLHLGNMCLFEGKPLMFDGIEFSEAYACCDEWADTAFFVMDLMFQRQEGWATTVINRVLEQTDDFGGLPLLNLYIAYRAMVRAKVNCLKLTGEAGSREELTAHARGHLALANRVLTPQETPVIVVAGLSGSGKTTLARALTEPLGALHIRSDVVRKHLLGIPLLQQAGSEAYQSQTNRLTYAGLIERARCAAATGRPIILDAVFGNQETRDAARLFAEACGLPWIGLWCEVSPEVARARLRTRRGDASDADEEVFQKQQSTVLLPDDWHCVTTEGKLPDIVQRAHDLIRSEIPSIV